MTSGSKLVLATIVVFLGACFAAAWVVIGRGFSARQSPSRIEALLARQARRLAVPRSAKQTRNPVSSSSEVLNEGMAHFADHCALCHANDGSGQTEIGQGTYPKPPDMRLAQTQNLTDGEIFYIIRNGVRFTGMPAFGELGKETEDEDSWKLVYFIRHLPDITTEEVERMEKMNPKSSAELEEEKEIERFLQGDDAQPAEKKHKH